MYIVLLFLLVLILVHCKKKTSNTQVPIKSSSGKEYYVLDSPQKQYVADVLDEVSLRVDKLFEVVPKPQRFKGQFEEAVPHLGKKFMGYTVNKGERIALCVEEDTDVNTLMYIVIHELSHVMTDEYGHGEEFYKNMTQLIEVAQKQGIYEHSQRHEEFCGNRITEVQTV